MITDTCNAYVAGQTNDMTERDLIGSYCVALAFSLCDVRVHIMSMIGHFFVCLRLRTSEPVSHMRYGQRVTCAYSNEKPSHNETGEKK